jgi:hypothetical protein
VTFRLIAPPVLFALLGAGIFVGLTPAIPAQFAAFLVIAGWTVLSRGPAPRLLLLAFFLVRWQALAFAAVPVVPLLIAAQALGRAGLVALAWISRPAGAAIQRWLTTPAALLAIVCGVAAAFVCGLRFGVAVVSASILLTAWLYRYTHRRFCGATDPVLAVAELAIQSLVLIAGACDVCAW